VHEPAERARRRIDPPEGRTHERNHSLPRDESFGGVKPITDRRSFIRGGLVGAASISFAALAARTGGAFELPYTDDYGPLSPVEDQTTGLPLLKLPGGFTYRSYGWTGQPMADGEPTPRLHDGMDVIAAGGKIYFNCTTGGALGQGERTSSGRGQVFVFDPRRQSLQIIFNSTGIGAGSTECNQPDNIAVSPRGGIVLCEDGSTSVSQKLRGLTPEGGTFLFADNNVNLSEQDSKQADRALRARKGVIRRIAPGNYTGSEWAGACFYEKWMFVNIQTPGITFAITGPWDNGAL
jgi:Bacterial protein of unknown function (DUF839)